MKHETSFSIFQLIVVDVWEYITIISMTLKTKPQKSVILGPKAVRISKKYHKRIHEKKRRRKLEKNFPILLDFMLKHLNGYKTKTLKPPRTRKVHVQLCSGVGICCIKHHSENKTFKK